MPSPDSQSRRARSLLTYVGVVGFGVLTLALVMPSRQGDQPAPQLARVTAVGSEAASCLGPRLVADQSGIYLDIHHPGPSQVHSAEEELGPRLARGQVDRRSGVAELRGKCWSGASSGGQALTATAQVTKDGSATGTLRVGGGSTVLSLTPVPGSAVVTTTGSTPLGGSELAARLFLAVAVVIVVSRFVGLLFTRIHQPRVIGEIVAGVLLGPSLLGALFPEVTNYLFPPEVLVVLRMMAQFGLIFFMFLIGLELEPRMLRGSGRAAVMVSHVSIVLPFCLGVLASLFLFPLLGSGNYVGFTLFMGAAMAITAFPVLARILTETGLHRTRVGAIAITCAAVDDITAWCLLAVVVAIVKSGEAVEALRTILLALVFVGVMLLGVRPIAARLAAVHAQRGRLNPPITAGLIVALFVSAWATEQIGIHAIFGAFMLGAVVPRFKPLVAEITGKIEDLTVLFLLPIFFAAVGLSTRIGLLDRASLWAVAALVILLAIVGKLAGTMIAARASRESWRDAIALGLLMNTRGLTEIVVLTLGRALGVVSPILFTIMVLMALVTTFMATPLLRLVYPRRVVEQEAQWATATSTPDVDRPPSPPPSPEKAHCVLVAVADPLQARSLVSLVAGLAAPSGTRPEVVLAHVMRPPGRDEVRTNLDALDEAAEAVRSELVPLASELLQAGFDARVRVNASAEPGEELARMAATEGAELVVLGRHRSYVGRNELGGVVRHALEHLRCDAAVVLDRPGRPPVGDFVAAWYRTPDDEPALQLATRLAVGRGEPLRVLRPDGVDLPTLAVPAQSMVVTSPSAKAFVEAASGTSVLVLRRSEVPDLSVLGHADPLALLLQPASERRSQRRHTRERRRRTVATTREA